MEYKEDIKEIIGFIACLDVGKIEKSVSSACINRFTDYTGEEYLDLRAKAIREALNNTKDVNDAFCRLSAFCKDSDYSCDKCLVNKYCNYYINQRRNSVSDNDKKIIDLFCGAGGLSLGFSQEGFITALANDIEKCCIETYAHNHPETKRKYIVQGDIKEVVDRLEDLVCNMDIDIVIGGPPCQGFSMANRQRIIDDPRNHLYKNYLEIVKRVKPKFFVMENVRGMFSVANQVVEDFTRIGYSTSFKILNAKDYGVPQNRERLIYIGNNIGINNDKIFDEMESLRGTIPNYFLKDALFGLRPLEASRKKNATNEDTEHSGFLIEKCRNSEINDYISYINAGKNYQCVCNHKARYNNDRDIEIYRRMNPGDKSDDPKIADIMPYTRRNGIFKDKYYKLEPNKVCKTITAHMKFDCNMYIHPTQARGLTPREAARVQSYPDDYFFKGAYTKTYMQIGNSVPPLLGRAIAKVIKKYI